MKTVSAAIAISSGLIVLLGYFVASPLLVSLRVVLLQWAILVGAVAVLAGAGNLLQVHLAKIRQREGGSIYSVILIFSMLGTIGLGIWFGPVHPWMQALAEGIIFPVEASLMALLAVTLAYASIRMLRQRTDVMSILFIASAVFVLAAGLALPFIGPLPVLGDWIGPWFIFGPVAGGARGLLIGVALGALTTGLRALLAMDRPYGGK